MAAITFPTRLAVPEFRFIKLGWAGEALKKPIEHGWNILNLEELEAHIAEKVAAWDLDEKNGKHENLRAKGKKIPKKPEFRGRLNNYAFDDPEFLDWLKGGNNYGVIYAGDLIKLESDDVERWKQLKVIDLLPETFTVQSSSPNRQHFYYIGPDVADSPLIDPTTGEDIGHIRGTGEPGKDGKKGSRGGMVVGPGSKHPSGVYYTVVKDLPIATITKDILGKVTAILIKPEPSKKEQNREKEKRSTNPNNYADPFKDLTCIDVLGSGWDSHLESGQTMGQNPYPGHINRSDDPHHALAIKSNDTEFYCFECQGGGGVSKLIAIRAGIMKCADPRSSPDGNDWWNTVRYALKEGLIREETAKAAGLKSEPDRSRRRTVLDCLEALLEHGDELEKTKEFPTWEFRLNRYRMETVVEKGTLTPEGERKAHKFLKQFNKALKSIGIDYFDLYPIQDKETGKEKFTEVIITKAKDILEHKDPVAYVTDSCSRVAIGADKLIKKFIDCISVMNVNQSAGLHPKLNGESSGGKTFISYIFCHHLPSEIVIKGSMSAKAGFYHSDGNRVLRMLDDYQAGNVDLDTTIKQTSADYHRPYKHRTVVNHEAKVLTIGSEQCWAITSVDGSQDIQVLNRQLPMNVDDSVELTKTVNAKTIERYTEGLEQYPVDEQVLVSRAMFQFLRDDGYVNVRIPFGDRIEWLDTSNRRDPSIFMDLVIAHTAMFRFQREKDENGYYLATEQDFDAARCLFTDNDGEELIKRLTKRERDVVDLLLTNKAGLTAGEIAAHLNVSPRRVLQILKGEKDTGGLMAKVQLEETKVSEMIRISEDKSNTIYKSVFSIKNYDHFAGFDAIVKLNPQREPSEKNKKYDGRNDGSNETGSISNEGSNRIVNKKEKERESTSDLPSSYDSYEDFFSLQNEKKPSNPSAVDLDSENPPFRRTSNDFTTLPTLEVCAVCGADLTGKGKLEKGGKAYCPKPGCGYPVRENAPTIESELRQAEIEVAKREAHFTTPEYHTGLSQAKQES